MTPEHDTGPLAARCVELLWKHMELQFKNRVEAKTGRSSSLELVRLSNLMTHAGLAHLPKARTPMSPTRLRRVTDAGIVINEQQRRTLHDVFMYYCSWAAKDNYQFMSRTQFLRFCRDTRIMGSSSDLDAVGLTFIYDKVQLESPDQAPSGRLTFVDWLQALQYIAVQMYPVVYTMPQQAWDTLVSVNVLKHAPKDMPTAQDPFSKVVVQEDFWSALNEARPKLQQVFDFYVHQQSISPPHTRQRRPQPVIAQTIKTLSRPISPHITNNALSMHLSLASHISQALNQTVASKGNAARTGSLTSFAGNNNIAGNTQDGISMSGSAQGLTSAHASMHLRSPSGNIPMLSNAQQPLHKQPSTQAAGINSSSSLKDIPGQVFSRSTSMAREFSSVQQARSQMPLPSFLRFLQDFDIIPGLLNKAQATACFRAARFGHTATTLDDVDVGRITFEEWLEALGRCSLLAFKFQVPKHPQMLLEFQGSYHQAAKQLWNNQARQHLNELMSYPDEISIPPADREDCIGLDDRPDYDKSNAGKRNPATLSEAGSRWGGRSMKSRTGRIYTSAESFAHYKLRPAVNHTSQGDDILVVNESLDMGDCGQSERPIHLKTFKIDWIGKPSPPLKETTTLRTVQATQTARSLGYYDGYEDLPPVYAERAANYIAGRVAREQVVEQLRLQYVAARREEDRRHVAKLTEHRRMLQAAARQCIVDETERASACDTTELIRTLQVVEGV